MGRPCWQGYRADRLRSEHKCWPSRSFRHTVLPAQLWAGFRQRCHFISLARGHPLAPLPLPPSSTLLPYSPPSVSLLCPSAQALWLPSCLRPPDHSRRHPAGQSCLQCCQAVTGGHSCHHGGRCLGSQGQLKLASRSEASRQAVVRSQAGLRTPATAVTSQGSRSEEVQQAGSSSCRPVSG